MWHSASSLLHALPSSSSHAVCSASYTYTETKAGPFTEWRVYNLQEVFTPFRNSTRGECKVASCRELSLFIDIHNAHTALLPPHTAGCFVTSKGSGTALIKPAYLLQQRA
jgi:hypothetical protein